MTESKPVKMEENDSFFVDNLYLEKEILAKLLDLPKLKSFFSAKSVSFEENVKGYVYLIETCLCRIINHQENLVRNERVYHLLHYKNYNLSQIKKVIKDDSEIDSMIQISELRDKLAKDRLGNKQPEDSLLNKIKVSLEILFNYYKSNVITKTIENNFLLKDKKFLLYLFHNHMDFMASTDIDPETEDIKFSLTIPEGVFCVSKNEFENVNYYLNSSEIIGNKSRYLSGYSASLGFLLDGLIDKDNLDKIMHADDWETIRRISHELVKSISINPFELYNYPLFIPKTDIIFKQLDKTEINNIEDFGVILKERDVQILDYYSQEQKVSLFISIFYGRIRLDGKVQVIRFKTEKKKGEYNLSYLINIPYGDLGFYNDSHWLFFYDLGLENDRGYKSSFVYTFENLIKKFEKNIELEDYKITNRLLLRFIKEFYGRERFGGEGDNLHYLFNEKNMIKFKEAKAILLELFANFLFKDSVIYSDVEIEAGEDKIETDIDCLVITDTSICLIQATSFLESDKKINRLKEHFEKAESNLGYISSIKEYLIPGKKIRKIIFCLESSEKSNVKKYLQDNQIELIEYKYIKNKMNKRLRGKINRIFDLTDIG